MDSTGMDSTDMDSSTMTEPREPIMGTARDWLRVTADPGDFLYEKDTSLPGHTVPFDTAPEGTKPERSSSQTHDTLVAHMNGDSDDVVVCELLLETGHSIENEKKPIESDEEPTESDEELSESEDDSSENEDKSTGGEDKPAEKGYELVQSEKKSVDNDEQSRGNEEKPARNDEKSIENVVKGEPDVEMKPLSSPKPANENPDIHKLLRECHRDRGSWFDMKAKDISASLPKMPGGRPATHTFSSAEQFRVVNIVGAVEESRHMDDQAEKLRKTPLELHLFEMPSATWDEDSAVSKYGIPSDQCPTSFYVVANLNGGELPVQVGDTCKMYLPFVSSRERTVPGPTQSRDDCIKMAGTICDKLQGLDASVDEYPDHARDVMAPFVNKVHRALKVTGIPETLQLSLSAVLHGMELKPRQDEDPKSHRDRCEAWALAHCQDLVLKQRSALGKPYQMERITLPPGTASKYALFAAEIPKQDPWTLGLTKPPMLVELPLKKFQDSLEQTFSELEWGSKMPSFAGLLHEDNKSDKKEADSHGATTATSNDEENGPSEIEGRTSGASAVWGLISFKPNSGSNHAEAYIVSSLSKVPQDSLAAKQVAWLRDFTASRPHTNLLAKYPSLRAAIGDGTFKGKHADAIRKLGQCGGYTFISGGSGTGKTILAANVAKCILNSGGSITRRVFWLALSNWHANEAIQTMSKVMPGLRAVRALPWRREMHDFVWGPVENKRYDGFDLDKDMVQQANKSVWKKDNITPSAVEHSLTASARRCALIDPYIAGKLQELELWRDSDNGNDHEREHEWKDLARGLFTTVVNNAQFIVATPVAFAQLMNNVYEKPEFAFGIVDNAGRMNEPQSLVPPVTTPDTPVLYVGDATQSIPTSHAADDVEKSFVFVQQRKMSLLARVNGAGKIDAELTNEDDAEEQTIN